MLFQDQKVTVSLSRLSPKYLKASDIQMDLQIINKFYI